MGTFFLFMISASTIIALVTSIVFFIGILFESQAISNTETYFMCDNQIKTCRIASIVFSGLYWFYVSGMASKDCLKGYANLSGVCSRWGSIWIIFAFINIVVSIFLGITKRRKGEMEIMDKLRKSSFLMGAVFLIISFILKVN